MAHFTSLSQIEKELYDKMVQSIKNLQLQKIGIAFSGGVDSSLLAKICKDNGYDSLLLTMGFANSHDVEFSKKIAGSIKVDHDIEIINEKSFPEVAKKIWDKICVDNISWNENCIAFYYVAKLAKKHNIAKVVTANGIDELFCGYNAYREIIPAGKDAVLEMMEEKLKNEIRMMKAVNQVTSAFDVEIVQPFLSPEFVEYARNLPLEHKIIDKDDLVRKHLVRSLAISLGVPAESARALKKAMQYGSEIHKNFLKIKKTWNTQF